MIDRPQNSLPEPTSTNRERNSSMATENRPNGKKGLHILKTSTAKIDAPPTDSDEAEYFDPFYEDEDDAEESMAEILKDAEQYQLDKSRKMQ
jgi:hypothetical protein